MSTDNQELTTDNMGDRVRLHLERELGFSLQSFASSGIDIRESSKRTDEPGNRLLIHCMADGDGTLVTGTPSVISAITPAIQNMSIYELFSPLGIAELRQALQPDDHEKLFDEPGFDYTLTNEGDFLPAKTLRMPVALMKADIPPDQFDRRMSERRRPTPEDFVWAFVCYREGQKVAGSVIIWGDDPDIAEFGVTTEEKYRGQGYGLAVVSAATQWILEQGAVPSYGAFASNIPSLRLARRLGFTLTYLTIRA